MYLILASTWINGLFLSSYIWSTLCYSKCNYYFVILRKKLKVNGVEMVLGCWKYTDTLAVMGMGSWAVGSNILPSGSKLDYTSWIWILLISLLYLKTFVDADIVLLKLWRTSLPTFSSKTIALFNGGIMLTNRIFIHK